MDIEDDPSCLSAREEEACGRDRELVMVSNEESCDSQSDDGEASLLTGSDPIGDIGIGIDESGRIRKEAIYLRTFGCSHNMSDGEYMAGLLQSAGYRMTDVEDEASLFLINSCTVKHPSEMRCVNLIERARKLGKHCVVGGCVPQANKGGGGPRADLYEGVSIVGVEQIHTIVSVVDETLKGNVVMNIRASRGSKSEDLPPLDAPKRRRNKYIEIVPLSAGCLGHCSFCKTKAARGNLKSYPPEEIIARVDQVIRDGVKDIWFTSEDTGAYGIDRKTDLPTLMSGILPLLTPQVMLRIGMTNPPYMLKHVDAVCDILNHPQVYAFLHIPVQAGSDRVLGVMRRNYKVADFCALVDRLIERVPNINISTDVIVGFPTETEEEFLETLHLIDRYKFFCTNITRYYIRPHTPAAKMEQLSTQVQKDRTRRMTKLVGSFTPLEHLVSTDQYVHITDVSDNGTHMVGHNKSYYTFLLERDNSLIGKTVIASVTSVTRWNCYAKVLSVVNE